jgi:creatinine amidohydrolase
MTQDTSEHEVAGLTWDRVKDRLAGRAAAILPIGAGSKQHGLHLPMATDQIFARYFARALADRIDALIWPTLSYGAYPAFVAYAGSVSLSSRTFQATVTEIAVLWSDSARAASSSSTRD